MVSLCGTSSHIQKLALGEAKERPSRLTDHREREGKTYRERERKIKRVRERTRE